jgi:hypothetical protein
VKVVKCQRNYAERVWTSSDGQRAVSPAHVAFELVSYISRDTISCAGKPAVMAFWYQKMAANGATAENDQMLLEMGADVMLLQPDAGLWTVNIDGEYYCFDVTGRWRGTAGSLLRRTGTYTMVYDSIQTVLHLVED